MIEERYLTELNIKCNELRSKVVYREIAEKDCVITYIPTKQTSFLGYKHGYYELFQMISKGLKESDKLKSNCKNYIEIYKDRNNKILQVKSIKKGKIDCIHQALYDGDKMYLFPFSYKGGFYPTYTYVSVSNGAVVQEEYMVNGNQIIYEQYEQQGEEVLYEQINFVINGSHPILVKESGVFEFCPFNYKRLSFYSWTYDRNKD